MRSDARVLAASTGDGTELQLELETESESRAAAAGVKRHQHKHSLKRRFELMETLGKGTYGKVNKAVERQSGRTVAIKSIRKERLMDELDRIHIKREIEITSSLTHSNIIQIYEVFESREKIVMVMEYVSGGELYEYLQERKKLSENEARHFFSQITSAVGYCHRNGVVHRDIKLENILLDRDLNVKLADFGLSNQFRRGCFLETFCGSPLYASPEIINGFPYQGPEVDCWALGVLLYALVYGSMPFDGGNYSSLKEQISRASYRKSNNHSDANALIDWLLAINVEERATVEDVANHHWINLSHAGQTGHSGFPKIVKCQTQASTLPRRNSKEKPSNPQHCGSYSCYQTTSSSCNQTSSSHNQPAKLPKKGILKKLYEQVEYQPSDNDPSTEQVGDFGSCQVIIRDNMVSEAEGRKRKGILKRSSEISGIEQPLNAQSMQKSAVPRLSTNIPAKSCVSMQYEEEDLEIEITVWNT